MASRLPRRDSHLDVAHVALVVGQELLRHPLREFLRRQRYNASLNGAHGSHLVDQIRSTLGEFKAVSASLVCVAERAMTAEDT